VEEGGGQTAKKCCGQQGVFACWTSASWGKGTYCLHFVHYNITGITFFLSFLLTTINTHSRKRGRRSRASTLPFICDGQSGDDFCPRDLLMVSALTLKPRLADCQTYAICATSLFYVPLESLVLHFLEIFHAEKLTHVRISQHPQRCH
jgi:hypothetical protein